MDSTENAVSEVEINMENISVTDDASLKASDVTIEEAEPSIEIAGKRYKPLADGEYDAILLGTGLKECLLSGLLSSVKGMKVLHLDRNSYYGGDSASLQLTELFEKFSPGHDMNAVQKRLGPSRKYSVDLIPKFLMSAGKMVKILLRTKVTNYLQFLSIEGSLVFNSGKLYRVPCTPTEMLSTPLVGFFQKRRLKAFADYLATVTDTEVNLASKDHEINFTDAILKQANGKEKFAQALQQFYQRWVPQKSSKENINRILTAYANREVELGEILSAKYNVPFCIPERIEVNFDQGSLGLIMRPTQHFAPPRNGIIGQAEKKGVIRRGDELRTIAGIDVLSKPYTEVIELIKTSPRPLIFERWPQKTKLTGKNKAKSKRPDLTTVSMQDLYDQHNLDENSQDFIGHAMALHRDETYKNKPACITVEALKLYGFSLSRFGNSPYVYPMYGLGELPQGFARLCVQMLRADFGSVLREKDGHVAGVTVGDMAAKAPLVIKLTQSVGKIVRAICILNHPIPNTNDAASAQIILPQKWFSRKNDIYVSVVSSSHQVAPKGIWLVSVSTTVETSNPTAEIQPAINMLGPILQKFEHVVDILKPVDNTAIEVLDLYEKIVGEPLDISIQVPPPDKKG